MCGIAGAFATAARVESETACSENRAVLAHRGPDHFGSWQEPGVALLHWRLAIIDLSAAGNQPMLSADERFVICYNGEVYNFQELRAEIEQQWRDTARSMRSWRSGGLTFSVA
jgi:asparagine synthase (glutamine-hydrolysing)